MSEQKMIDVINSCSTNPLGVTSSPSTTLDITIDIREDAKHDRALGQMVYVILEEDGQNILVIGQIISIETKNRWHEDPSFKGVIKRHGSLPHLSGTADNRIATISVQACYALDKGEAEGYILGTSPSTGERVHKMNNEVMKTIMQSHERYITYMGKVYGTDVDLPFWFKHFGETSEGSNELGAGDAFHIGVFGKTGSGKSVTATYMLLGYVKNKTNMSILVLDPQGQFYLDKELLPGNLKVEDAVKKIGMNYEKYKIVDDIFLPSDRIDIFAEMLKNNGFIEEAFWPIYTPDKFDAMTETVSDYLNGYINNPSFNLGTVERRKLLKDMLTRFITLKDKEETKVGFSKYVTRVWGTQNTRQRLVDRINNLINNLNRETSVIAKWESVLELFSPTKSDGTEKKAFDYLVDKIVKAKGNFIVLDDAGAAVKLVDDYTFRAVDDKLTAAYHNRHFTKIY